MAYSHRRTNFTNPLPAAHRSVFLDHARPTVVRVGVALRLGARHSLPCLRYKWRFKRNSLALRFDRRRSFRVPAFATATARHRFITSDRVNATGGGGFDHSFVRASSHCELAFFAPVVCGPGKMGGLESTEGKTAAMGAVVFPSFHVALGQSARRMAFRNCAPSDLHIRRMG